MNAVNSSSNMALLATCDMSERSVANGRRMCISASWKGGIRVSFSYRAGLSCGWAFRVKVGLSDKCSRDVVLVRDMGCYDSSYLIVFNLKVIMHTVTWLSFEPSSRTLHRLKGLVMRMLSKV